MIKLMELEKTYASMNDFHEFVKAYHFTPDELIPSVSTLAPNDIHLFSIIEEATGDKIGVTSYKALSKTLVEIQKTILHPQYRGNGYGRPVVEAMENVLEKRGFKKMMAFVYTTNLSMIILRLKTGFLIEGLLRNSDAPGIDEYIMGKEIDNGN